MARANDSWERLIESVLRRNRLWKMFHAQSRTPSSAASSTDYPFVELSDDKFESRRYVQDQNLEDFTQVFGAHRIGKTKMARRVGEMVKEEGRLFNEVIRSHGGGLSHYGNFSYGYASYSGPGT